MNTCLMGGSSDVDVVGVVAVGVLLVGVLFEGLGVDAGAAAAGAALELDEPPPPPPDWLPGNGVAGVGVDAEGLCPVKATNHGDEARPSLPEPTMTPRASVPSTATAMARGEGSSKGSSSRRAKPTEWAAGSDGGATCSGRLLSAVRETATRYGRAAVRAPHSTQ
jgi:hypothetical protein